MGRREQHEKCARVFSKSGARIISDAGAACGGDVYSEVENTVDITPGFSGVIFSGG
jgi:hypothetical protein